MAKRIIITGATVFTGDDVVEGNLVLRDGLVEHLGGGGTAGGGPAETIEARGRLVTPGLTIGHTHIYSALARGIVLPGEPARNFVEILEKLWWLLDRHLTLEQVELSALLHGMDCLKSGVTTVFDHHASFGAIRGSLAVIAEALARVGLRGCLCYEVSDRAGEAAARQSIEENVDFIRGAGSGSSPLVRGMFGLHASFTLSRETLRACAAAASPDETGFHIHVAEDREDQAVTLARYGKRVIPRLLDEGILGRRTICSHCIWLEEDEIRLLAGSGSTVAYNPQSNMNNAVGALRLKGLTDRGVPVVLGTDGFTANILREALVGQILQNHVTGDPSAGWIDLPGMLLGSNNDLMRTFFGFDNGKLRPGERCDVVLWDYTPPTPLLAENVWGHGVFGLLDSRASAVILDGRLVLRDGRCTGIDEDEVASQCRAAAASLWKSMA